MNRAQAVIGSAVFLIIAPGFVAVLVPWWIAGWRVQPAFFGLGPFPFLGALLVIAGAVGLLDSFARFAVQGIGTPAPVLPTRRLVVTGLYRYVRNPMYATVAAAIVGQAFLLGNVALFGYRSLVWLLSHIFVISYEEPKLRASFGSEYESFYAAVPRWIPRISPWKGV